MANLANWRAFAKIRHAKIIYTVQSRGRSQLKPPKLNSPKRKFKTIRQSFDPPKLPTIRYFTKNRRVNAFFPLLYSLFLFVNVSQEPNQSSQWNRSVTIITLHFSEVVFPLLKCSRDGFGKSRKEEKPNN